MARSICPRNTNYADWYVDVVLNAKLADYSPVKGTMVIRPRGYALWERMQAALDAMFKESGHQNAYFPLLIPESFLRKEAEHVEGFAPEVVVVTHGGGELLEEPLIIRPTSETIIWSMYRKWIQSYRDLPLLINQWANVLRWEKRTRLFLRTTEFLWQEGHTAHASADEARAETQTILEIYRRFAEEYMAMPVITGLKTESEKFAGAVETYAIEAMMQDRKALQSGTSHFLGQNFAKAFEVTFQNRAGTEEYVWATSWGVSTRLIGALIMAHSDDNGLVTPPRLAPTEAVIIPIFRNDSQTAVLDYANRLRDELRGRFRVALDDDKNNSPGWKFAEWELLGVPLRIECGPRDVAADVVTMVRRDTGDKEQVPRRQAAERVGELLQTIQREMYARAHDFRESNTQTIDDWPTLEAFLNAGSGFALAPWCGSPESEALVKERTKATIRLLPTGAQARAHGKRCAITGAAARHIALFARNY